MTGRTEPANGDGAPLPESRYQRRTMRDASKIVSSVPNSFRVRFLRKGISRKKHVFAKRSQLWNSQVFMG